MMEIIPENLDWNRNRCHGDEGKSLISSSQRVTGVCINWWVSVSVTGQQMVFNFRNVHTCAEQAN